MTKISISICRDNSWDYMINFKSGSMPAVYKEAEELMRLTPENTLETQWGDWKQIYTYSNELDYEYYNADTGKKNRIKLNVVKCIEEWQEVRADKSVEENDVKGSIQYWLLPYLLI